jgi:ATP-binding cassette subfamily B protein
LGFFSGLGAEAYDRTYSDRELVLRILSYFKPHRQRLVLASLAITVLSVSAAAVPILISNGVDWLVQEDRIASLILLVISLFLLGALVWGTNWIRRRLTTRVVGDVMLALRTDAFQAAAGHDMAFYDEYSSGRVVSRITSDTQEFAQVIVLVTDLVSQFVQVGILLVVLINIELHLTLWLLAMLPVIMAVALGFRRIARTVTRRGMRAMANVNALIKEAVTGIAIAKNFRQEMAIYDEFNEVNKLSYKINIQRGFVLSSVFPTLNALGGIGTALLTYLGGLSAAQGVVTAGAWYLFIRGLERSWFPVLNLSAFWSQVQGGLSASERVFALIDAESNVKQSAETISPTLQGSIQFQSMGFRYKPDEPIFQDFNLSINPGENIAFVGHTGAGKSSLVKLLLRYYEFQEGSITLDGNDIRRLELKAFRDQIGVVSQVPFLFSGTVADNIRYARADARLSDIQQLADRIGEGEWLDNLPNGLETQVGERGNQLSMGQRQLVALMRVLIQKPAIFILDEATANIDPFTESQIQEALRLILEDATSILIAHRLSTVKAADRIIVLREGEIIEEGDHRSLLDQQGYYAELYNTYFRHQSLEYIDRIGVERLNA